MGLLGQQPALGEQIAQRAGDGLEALALAGVFHGDDMVEDQMPIVGTDNCFLAAIQNRRARIGLGGFIRNESTAHIKALFLIKVK